MNLDQLNLQALRPILPFPLWQKLAALATVFVLIVLAYLYLGWFPLQDEIKSQQAQVESQQALLARNLRLAKDLPKKQKEFAQLERQLKIALSMLPKQSQIPDLLEDVSVAGKDSGLEFSVFKPGNESVKQIYAEVPVSLNFHGTYRQLLTFLKRVGEMPRIVAIKDLKLAGGKGEILSVSGNAVTYHFVEEKKATGRKARRR